MSDISFTANADEMEALFAVVETGSSGKFECPRCRADGKWERSGRSWGMHCDACDWNAAGLLKPSRERTN